MNIIEYENYHEKKERGHSDFPYITYPCSIPLDFSKVPLHWHDEMELIYIKKGQGLVTVDYLAYHVTSGDILIIVPGRLHSIEQEKGFSMEYENIIFQPALLLPRQADICSTKYFQPLFYNQLNVPEYLSPHCHYYGEAARCLDQADFLCQHRPPAYEISVKAQLLQFFYVLFTHLDDKDISLQPSNQETSEQPPLDGQSSPSGQPDASRQPTTSGPASYTSGHPDASGSVSYTSEHPDASGPTSYTSGHPDASGPTSPLSQSILTGKTPPLTRNRPHSIEKAKLISKHIENHYAEKLTIKEMAQVCSLSQSHFMKFFKSVFGMPFIPYLREYRLIMASRLLLTSSSSILEIAEETGFENLSYFNRSFKAMYGQTPREFRAHAIH